MRKLLIRSLALFFITGFVFVVITGCKKKNNKFDFVLKVTVYDGVTGTPATGTYQYNGDDKVTYNYSLEAGYNNLKVIMDGEEIASSGTITITSNRFLQAFSSEGTGEHLLGVEVRDGVNGSPESGFYYYNLDDQVNYSYTLKDGYFNLVVALDGRIVGDNGTVTISDNHTLVASASKKYSIGGTWELEEMYEDGSAFSVNLTFTGSQPNGTVTDSDGGTGTYTVEGANVSFTLNYPDVRYEYTGIIYDDENMNGNSKRYISETLFKNGSWAARKETN